MRKPNPSYGSGAYRRRLRWHAEPRQVQVDLEDSNHAFRLQLRHDGERVLAVDGVTHRHPFVTCAEAVKPLQRLVGERLDADAGELRQRFPAGDNCTHLHDMGLLALAHAREAGAGRLYDIIVDDEREGVTRARIACDGQPVHNWEIRQQSVSAPESLQGRPMFRGFFAWASDRFQGMALEAAVALQRGYFVAQSRRTANSPAVENPATADRMPQGSCYSYNTGVVERALRVEGSIWDLTDKPDILLQYRDQP